MSPIASYAIEGVVYSAGLALLVWGAGRLWRKPLPSPLNVNPGKEWHVSDATRNAAVLASDRDRS